MTIDLTDTVEWASIVPMADICTGTFFDRTGATATGTARLAGGSTFPLLEEQPEYKASAPVRI